MKLEMTVHGLNVNLELDDNGYNGLEVLQHVKDLLDELSAYEQVTLTVVTAPQDEDDLEDEDYDEMTEQDHEAQAVWPFPIDGHIDQDGEVVAFLESETKTA